MKNFSRAFEGDYNKESANIEYNNLLQKVSNIRLDTIKEEETINHSVAVDPYEYILSSEDEIEPLTSQNTKKKMYRYSVSDCTNYLVREKDLEADHLEISDII